MGTSILYTNISGKVACMTNGAMRVPCQSIIPTEFFPGDVDVPVSYFWMLQTMRGPGSRGSTLVNLWRTSRYSSALRKGGR
ncbi:hypothetical protein K443DRAFT_686915, partial [Laccaria amethystina LaAM-08-1]